MKQFIILATLTALFACNSGKRESKLSNNPIDTLRGKSDTVIYDNRRENLKLSTDDTIKLSKSYFFSNSTTKDIFLLTIKPGFVKNSKAELQIITIDGKVIYAQSFDTFYFIKGIYEPDTVPQGGQEVYDKYMEKYWQSLTPKQYETYFKKSIKNFLDAISFIDKDKFKEVNTWGDISDKDFLNEVIADSTIKLIDIACFDCDEGGSVMGYSKKQGKVVTLLDHD